MICFVFNFLFCVKRANINEINLNSVPTGIYLLRIESMCVTYYLENEKKKRIKQQTLLELNNLKKYSDYLLAVCILSFGKYLSWFINCYN